MSARHGAADSEENAVTGKPKPVAVELSPESV